MQLSIFYNSRQRNTWLSNHHTGDVVESDCVETNVCRAAWDRAERSTYRIDKSWLMKYTSLNMSFPDRTEKEKEPVDRNTCGVLKKHLRKWCLLFNASKTCFIAFWYQMYKKYRSKHFGINHIRLKPMFLWNSLFRFKENLLHFSFVHYLCISMNQ